MPRITKEEHSLKEAWLRNFFNENPSASIKAANDAVYEQFGARVRNQTVYIIRQEVRDALGLRVEDVQPRKGRPIVTMHERKLPPRRSAEEGEDPTHEMFDQQEEPPPIDDGYRIEPLDPMTGEPIVKKKTQILIIEGVGPASIIAKRKKTRVLVEGTPEQLAYLADVLNDLHDQRLTDLTVASMGEDFAVIERKK